MTTFDLIDTYLFDCTSSKYRSGIKPECGTMIEEMNDIREKYRNGVKIDEILNDCVCNRHGHQYCIPKNAVKEAVDALMKSVFVCGKTSKPFVLGNKLFNGFADFEQLYDFVNSVIGKISGIGPLTVYDTAKRIGHIFENPIYPKQYVYLAAGAMAGAIKLLNRKTLSFREPIIVFQPYFGTLSSIFIEDILCIYKGLFRANSITISGTTAFLSYKSSRIYNARKITKIV